MNLAEDCPTLGALVWLVDHADREVTCAGVVRALGGDPTRAPDNAIKETMGGILVRGPLRRLVRELRDVGAVPPAQPRSRRSDE